MKIVLTLFALVASLTATSRSLAATGDILSVVIDPGGWQALVTVEGLGTGGVYDLGLGTNGTVAPPASPKIILTLVSRGFNDQGEPAALSRTIYGTRRIRKPFPNEAQADETLGAGNVTVKVALSDYVFADCSNITAAIGASFYTQGGNGNRASNAVAVLNNSIHGHARVIGNWSWPGYERISGPTFTLRAVAFHRSGQQGRPVRAVRFTATDQNGNSVTNFVTTPTIDTNLNDAVPVIEYVATLSSAGLNQGDLITCQFKAYPWIGDGGSPLDTADGAYSRPTPYYAPLFLVNDRLGTYGVTIAVVDVAGGNDTTGSARTTGLNTNSPPPAFATIAAAAQAISQTNNAVYGRNDVGAGVIYLRSGNYPFTGGTRTYGNKPNTWLTITRYPGTTRNQVSINNQIGNRDISDRVKVDGIQLISSAGNTFDFMETLWIHDCFVDSLAANNQWIANVTNLYVTATTVTNWGSPASSSSGIRPGGGSIMAPVLVRGNSIIGPIRKIVTYTVLGNRYSGPPNQSLSFRMNDDESTLIPPMINVVFAYNVVHRYENSGGVFLVNGGNQTNLHGVAVVQNLLENLGSSISGLLWQAADGSTNPINHVLVWNNTLAGQRMNCGYNDAGNGPTPRLNWSLKQNIMYKHAIKADLFPPQDGRRTGNWAVLWGVGAVGNAYGEINGVSGAGSFQSEFPGLASYQPRSGVNPAGNWFQFVDPKCFDGAVVGTGGGDYHLRTNSPVFSLGQELLLLWDVEGQPREAGDPPGALADSSGSAIGAFRINSITSSNLVVTLRWETIPGLVYGIQTSGDLFSWNALATNLVSSSNTFSFSTARTVSNKFFRVLREP